MTNRFTLSLALTVIAAGAAALVPITPRCRRERPAEFGNSNLLPYISCRSFNCPKWAPIDLHLVSAPIGTAADQYAEFLTSAGTILPPPFHRPHPALGIGPGDPLLGPYDFEMAWGVHDSGFFEGRNLRLSQFRDGNGAILAFNVVPQGSCGEPADKGSSPDFAHGDIIGNELFPIHVESVTSHNGDIFSIPSVFDVPALDNNLNPPFDVDGHSRFPMFIAENTSFALHPDTPIGFTGVYRFNIRMTDAENSGWIIDVRFVVVQPYQ
jgi:hypothetical protein